jgi:hypothetical protein
MQIIRGCGEEYPDTPHPFALLGLCGQRRRKRTTSRSINSRVVS